MNGRMRVGVVAKPESERAVAVAGEISDRIVAAGGDVAFEGGTREALAAHRGDEEGLPGGVPVADLSACDLVVSVGGDGTFLYAARGAGRTPLLGVNVGEVGFLNAVAPADAPAVAVETATHVCEGASPAVSAFPRIVASGADWTLPAAVNDVVILGERRGHGGGLDVTVRVDGSRYTGGRADGVLVATPIGSTAYNLSEGGPLVHHGVDGLVVAGMAGDGLRPPLVVDVDAEVTVEVQDAPRGVVVGDGRVRESIEPPTTVTVARADEPLRVAEPSLEFFSALGKLD